MSKIVGTYKVSGRVSSIESATEIEVTDATDGIVIISKINNGIYKFEETFGNERIIGTGFENWHGGPLEFVAENIDQDGETTSLSIKATVVKCGKNLKQIVVEVYNYVDNLAVILVGREI